MCKNFALVRKSRHYNTKCACANVHDPSAVCKPLPLSCACCTRVCTRRLFTIYDNFFYAHGVWLLHTAPLRASIKVAVQLPVEYHSAKSKKPRKETSRRSNRKTAFEQRSRYCQKSNPPVERAISSEDTMAEPVATVAETTNCTCGKFDRKNNIIQSPLA